MKTVKDVFTTYKHSLGDIYNASEAEALTLLVLSEILDISKASLKAFPEKELTDRQSAKFEGILTELNTGKPVQYILGQTEFYGLPFNVNPSVLIPRPETEELVDWILTGAKTSSPKTILDIGTGSGCIAISLKKSLRDADTFAIDISPTALATASSNAELNEVDINFIQADILNFDRSVQLSKFDIIVSNPPYVTGIDKQQMHNNVTDFEPHVALFVPNNDPLLFYKAIADFALEYLRPNGQLYFEINENYGSETADMLSSKGFVDIELRKDLPGRDRMIKAITLS
ncbi:peptide chain release factor N(5)-glutamine methyltransferase [Mucilaginibacter myungsuensis]|uniref:Release factor glutamine methyltransferase n=1 Tax=Mucilaginibacter myungsuensis TaxID=649104 RepID=A0A929L1A5_9SPHI|nr:peptide chain release factor N(5)-glutamine methyltransferase [Mucilaginibacter myungsuensis]MBE9664382.1 peptide chain release factor N(5)-glutamine methyltransferase [Mucilaginibacter myungsuensis]MDN3597093.1 peptide chain release factor N(5)-glutamine methyltransferase [Mucilaginibacter myungsuensis]